MGTILSDSDTGIDTGSGTGFDAGFDTMSVAAILAETARRMPDNVAVVVGDQETTYAELWDQTMGYAGALAARGVGAGTPVAVLIPNVADFPRVYYAILALGGIVVPIHALLKSEEIVIRGHNLFTGYLNKPEETTLAMVDGWFRSGDLGTLDDDGYVTIVDRTKDMIVRNGYNVYPREVEEVLARHPAVAQVAVFGISHETHGQEIVAAVILASDATATDVELIAFAKQHLAAFKYPRRVEFLESFPTGPSGKVLKRELVASYEAG